MKTRFMTKVLADFTGNAQTPPDWRNLCVDGAPHVKGTRASIILEGPNNVTLQQALKFNFKASKYQAKYKALIVGLKLAKKIGAKKLRCYTDSQLV